MTEYETAICISDINDRALKNKKIANIYCYDYYVVLLDNAGDGIHKNISKNEESCLNDSFDVLENKEIISLIDEQAVLDPDGVF